MRITCPTCGARYEVGPDRIGAGGRTVECTACHSRWLVRNEARAAPAADRASAAASVLSGRDFAWERPTEAPGAREAEETIEPDAELPRGRDGEPPRGRDEEVARGRDEEAADVSAPGAADPGVAAHEAAAEREDAQDAAGAAEETPDEPARAAAPRAGPDEGPDAGDAGRGRLRGRASPAGTEGPVRAQRTVTLAPSDERPGRRRRIVLVLVLLVLLLGAALYLYGDRMAPIALGAAPLAAGCGSPVGQQVRQGGQGGAQPAG